MPLYQQYLYKLATEQEWKKTFDVRMVSGEVFHTFVTHARAARQEVSRNCKKLKVEEYNSLYKCFLVVNPFCGQDHLLAGFAVGVRGQAAGELRNMFSVWYGLGKRLMKHAMMHNITHLNCYEPYLPKFYAKYGFEEYKRDRNKRGEDHPDLVWMRLNEEDEDDR